MLKFFFKIFLLSSKTTYSLISCFVSDLFWQTLYFAFIVTLSGATFILQNFRRGRCQGICLNVVHDLLQNFFYEQDLNLYKFGKENIRPIL